MKIKYLFGLVLATMLYSSCSEDMMDRINKDETSKTGDRVGAQFQLTDAEVATAYSVVNGAYAWYVSSYTEQLFGTGNNQLLKIEQRQVSEVAGATTFNNEWNATYSNLMNLTQMIEKCSEGGPDAGKDDLLGMAQLLAALNWGLLTDLHGDIPFSDCFTGALAPKIDSQESIYAAILAMIDEGIANCSMGGSNGSKQDIIYGGNTEKWVALGHALKARYLLHTYNRNPSVLSQVEAEAQAAIDGGFEGFYLGMSSMFQFNGVSADNAWSAYQWSRYYIGSSMTVDDLMLEREDPREPYYNMSIGGDLVGVPGSTELASLTQTLNEPAWLENGAANLAIMSESELYFILAEVQAMQGKDATEAFQMAVSSNVAEYISICDDEIDAEDIEAYIEGIMPLFEADPLKEIRIQKYLAGTRGEVIETYNDMRRIGLDEYPVEMTNPNNNGGAGNRWPNMLPYGDSDVVSNPNVAAAFGSGNDAGMYIFTKKVWWAK
jgi:hypothetical protein